MKEWSKTQIIYVTFIMHLWRERSCSRVGSSSVATVPPLKDPSAEGGPTISLQVLPKNLWTPSIPLVFHCFESLEDEWDRVIKKNSIHIPFPADQEKTSHIDWITSLEILEVIYNKYLRGPINISYKRRESAPYSETTSSGFTTFPLLLLILWARAINRISGLSFNTK